MKIIARWRSFSTLIRTCVLSTLLSAPAFALDLNLGGPQVIATEGSGTSTISSLVPNPDGTISIEAAQSGNLSHIGNVTGSFSYLATIDPNTGTTVLTGNGYLDTNNGRINVAVTIVEFGADYPKPYVGGISITGGTGKFAGAAGFLETTGIDGESLTDSFRLGGFITTFKK